MLNKILLSSLLLSALLFPQQILKTIGFGIGGGTVFAYTDYQKYKPGYLGYININYLYPSASNTFRFGMKLGFETGIYHASEEIFSYYHNPTANLIFMFGTEGFTTSVEPAFGLLAFNPVNWNGDAAPNNRKGIYTKIKTGYGGNLVFKIWVSERTSLDASGTIFFPFTKYLDDKESWRNEYLLSAKIGFSVYFGPRYDDDGDDVENDVDKCPGTPPGSNVDSSGCPDLDKDSVFDDLDKCPDTPANTPVDEFGCTKDSDGDGYHDGIDDCPHTKSSEIKRVNNRGCSPSDLDLDEDGIPNISDDCDEDAEDFNFFDDDDGCPDKTLAPYRSSYDFNSVTMFNTKRTLLTNAGKKYLEETVKAYLKKDISNKTHWIIIIKGPDKRDEQIKLLNEFLSEYGDRIKYQGIQSESFSYQMILDVNLARDMILKEKK